MLLSAEFGAALDAVDGFFAGMADALTAGLSTRARAGMYGDSATKNHSGGYFVAGQITGTVLGMAIGAGSPCALGTGLKVGYRVLEGAQILGGAINAGQNLAEGNYLAAAGDAVGVVGGVASFMKACFVAGTPVVTKLGSKPAESFRSFEDHGEDCDWVLARDEHNDDAEPRYRRVLRTFERLSPVLWLTVGGQKIGTTREHPFFVRGKGWTNAGELRVGDELRLLSPGWVKVEGVEATHDLVHVYNMEVEDDHTYFVGDVTWEFAVWVHNAYHVVDMDPGIGMKRASGTLSREEAARAARAGENIGATTRKEAKELAEAVSPTGKAEHDAARWLKTEGGKTPVYQPGHYHPVGADGARLPGIHIYYG